MIKTKTKYEDLRILPLQGSYNARELGGYKTKSGRQIKYHKILRSAGLNNLTDWDKDYLEEYGLRKIVDFRSAEERNHYPDQPVNGCENIFNPVFEEDMTRSAQSTFNMMDFLKDSPDGCQKLIDVYAGIIHMDHAKRAYHRFFEILLENDKPGESVLFHCTAGKDRTGIGGVLVLSALGTDLETVTADYMLSKENVEAAALSLVEDVKKAGGSKKMMQGVYDLNTVRPIYIETALKEIENNYGTIADYLHTEIGINDEDLKLLTELYLE